MLLKVHFSSSLLVVVQVVVACFCCSVLGNVLAVRCLVFGEALFLLVVWLEGLIFVGYFALALWGTQGCTFTFGF